MAGGEDYNGHIKMLPIHCLFCVVFRNSSEDGMVMINIAMVVSRSIMMVSVPVIMVSTFSFDGRGLRNDFKRMNSCICYC